VKITRKVLGFIVLASIVMLGSSLYVHPQSVSAANPGTINFQGKVVNSDGTNVTDGTYPFSFKLYSVASGGSVLWTEADSLTVTSGVFQVSLGTNTSLSTIDFNANPALYLGITFNNDAAGEMTPRPQLQSVPYAFNSDKVGGLAASQLVQLSPAAQQSGTINVAGSITTANSVVTPSLVSSGALSINSGGATTVSLDTGGAATLSIGSTNASSVTISRVGQTTAINGGLTVAAAATFGGNLTATTGSITTSNLGVQFAASTTGPTCSVGVYSIYANSTESSLKKCVNGVVTDVESNAIRSFVDTTSTPVVANSNATSYWKIAAENNNSFPNFTLSQATKSIFGIVTMETVSTGTQDVEITARVENDTTSGKTCGTGIAVGGSPGTFASNTNARKTSTTTFIYNPGSTAKQYFNVCSDTATIGTTANITRIRVSLWEVDNSNADLAEVYPTNDSSLAPGELVSLDPSIANGVKRSIAYDKNTVGVVSTSPALVIGGKGDQGVTGEPIALSGRVPVKISDENGAVKAGDVLTASSKPGVAMRATKACLIIGTAMDDAKPGIDSVMTFVRSAYFNGFDVTALIPSATNPGNPSSQEVLNYMVSQNLQAPPLALSQITTDTVNAGIQVITPSVITDTLTANNNAQFNKDVHIGGTLYVDKIIATSVEGLSLPPSASSAKDQTAVTQLSKSNQDSATSNLNLASASLSGGLTVGGDITVAGLSSFQKLATFFAKAIFKQDVQIDGHLTLAADSAGYASLRTGEKEVHVTFKTPYDSLPIVLVGPGEGQFTQATAANIAKDGFDIAVAAPMTQDTKFSWSAVNVNAPQTATNPLPTAAP
jgi:hypothetical protein